MEKADMLTAKLWKPKFQIFTSPKSIILVNIFSALLIFLFTYAAVSKLVVYKVFYGQINSQPMPNWMTPYLVVLIPAIEILIAVALMFDKTRSKGFLASFILMSIFTGYIGLILLNAFNKIPCSCGGVLEELGWKQHLFFNIFFVFVSLTGFWLRRNLNNAP